MKKVFVLLSAALAMFSCSDDDENVNEVTSGELVGSWSLVTRIEDNTVIDLDECNVLNTLTFTETTMTSESFFKNDSEECAEDGTSTFDYKVSDNTLTLTNSEDVSTNSDISVSSTSILQITVTSENNVEIQRSYKKL